MASPGNGEGPRNLSLFSATVHWDSQVHVSGNEKQTPPPPKAELAPSSLSVHLRHKVHPSHLALEQVLGFLPRPLASIAQGFPESLVGRWLRDVCISWATAP